MEQKELSDKPLWAKSWPFSHTLALSAADINSSTLIHGLN
jgi:hypothetical protein